MTNINNSTEFFLRYVHRLKSMHKKALSRLRREYRLSGTRKTGTTFRRNLFE